MVLSFLKRPIIGLLLTLLYPGLAQAQIKVVATTGMIADTAKTIAGSRADIQGLIGYGIDPHGFRQTRSDIVALLDADLVLWNGLYLEAQMEDFLLRLQRQKPVIAVAETIPRDLLLSSEEYPDRFDPHIWMDPDLWQIAVQSIRDALIAVDPAGEDIYRANTQAYLRELSLMSEYSILALMSVPETARVVLSAHDAFNYFGARYGYEVLGIQGISTESEAGLRRIETLVDLLVSRDIRAVFVESSVSDRNVKALIEGAAAQGHSVSIGGELFSDAMGPPGTYEGTYIGMIDHNVTTITRALGGQAPAKGRLNQLGR